MTFDEIKAYLERADESLTIASELLINKHYDVSASRSYYAVFYAVTALLLSEGLEVGKHSATISFFHQKFIKTGKLDKHFGKNISWLFELRGVGDYGVKIHVTVDEAKEAIKIAQEFVSVIKGMIKR